MKPPPFEYHAPTSTDEAVALLAEHADDAKVLAGGQSLMPLLSLRLSRPGQVIDVNGIAGLDHVDLAAGLAMGATTRHRAIERSEAIRAANPLLAEAVGYIGHTAIRNRGTIGGSVAHADPAAELPMLLVALDGAVDVSGPRGRRTIPAAELYSGFLMTTIEPDELVTAVVLPAWQEGTGWSVKELSRRSGDFAIVGVAATLRVDDGTVAEARLAFAGVAGTPVRAARAEAQLVGQAAGDELWAAAAAAAAAELDPPGDVHASTAYRRHLAGVLARRALAEASDRTSRARSTT